MYLFALKGIPVDIDVGGLDLELEISMWHV
jgi:hypothetical protein